MHRERSTTPYSQMLRLKRDQGVWLKRYRVISVSLSWSQKHGNLINSFFCFGCSSTPPSPYCLLILPLERALCSPSCLAFSATVASPSSPPRREERSFRLLETWRRYHEGRRWCSVSPLPRSLSSSKFGEALCMGLTSTFVPKRGALSCLCWRMSSSVSIPLWLFWSFWFGPVPSHTRVEWRVRPCGFCFPILHRTWRSMNEERNRTWGGPW